MAPTARSNAVPHGNSLKRWLKRAGLTRRKAAEMCGASARQFDRYCLPETSNGHTPLPPARWELLQLKTEKNP